jgi:hypothetical protein
MARGPEGLRIAILATDGVERVELEQPRGARYGHDGGIPRVLSEGTGLIRMLACP